MSRSFRPKRAGEDYSRTHHGLEEEASTSKKARFDLRNPSALAPDELEDDAVLDADEIGRRGQGVRRNAVNLDGYQSDSDNEGYDVRAEARAKAKKQQHADEDEDMFADLKEDDDENDAAEPLDEDDAYRQNKKTVHFMKNEQIEGQVESSRGGRAVRVDLADPSGKRKLRAEEAESESESEVDDEERDRVDTVIDEEIGAGGKKTHAPLIDAFNMRNEQEEGQFDDQGNYIRKAVDPDAVHDTWLDGLSKKDIRRAREAADKRETERREKDKENDSLLASDLLRTLISHLQRGETVLEALARLGKGLRKRPKWQSKQRSKNKKAKNGLDNGEANDDAEMAEENPEEVARKEAIEKVTGAADLLLTRGQTDIYDSEREVLTRQYLRETGEEWVDPPKADENQALEAASGASKAWEYRWSDARDGGEMHGPYDSAMMQSWSDAGYFGDGVEFRRVGDSQDSWSRVTTFS
ncbi:uncharacterized protein TRUGW13939_07866 [Talaromyces rugulosus]|uniref:GYF domain-containing protein n=1 Tax=Talaromyces rugulosus TaxID=121627 RepID=A0A7H8R2W3_TALRU|nr:uncharacterized protein TRUGW13939_07866 [Talaromyces rugulosus]QKX60720.1 hypothetical protein TRUGW13939_07866 [Talaromyces rugulosus]